MLLRLCRSGGRKEGAKRREASRLHRRGASPFLLGETRSEGGFLLLSSTPAELPRTVKVFLGSLPNCLPPELLWDPPLVGKLWVVTHPTRWVGDPPPFKGEGISSEGSHLREKYLGGETPAGKKKKPRKRLEKGLKKEIFRGKKGPPQMKPPCPAMGRKQRKWPK